MSPEQLRSSKDVDARTDIWSLGVCLFEIATGRMPFSAQNLHEHYTKLMLEPPPLPSEVRSDLPPELDAIVKRCLQREPGDRYPSVVDLARDLAKLAPDGARSAHRVERTLAAARTVRPSRPSLPAPPVALPPSGILSDSSTADKTELSGRRRARRDLRVALVVGLLVIAGAFAFVLSRVKASPVATAAPILPSAQATSPTPPPSASAIVVVAPPEPEAPPAPSSSTSSTSPPKPRAVVRPAASAHAFDPVDLEHRK